MPYRSVSLASIRYARPRPAALVTTSGRFILAEIMRRAVQIARSIRAGGKGWGWRMAIGLKSAWKAAREEREAAMMAAGRGHHAHAFPAPRDVLRPARPVRTFDVGSRRFSHGW